MGKAKCSCGDKTAFEGMILEINAGKVMFPRSESQHTFNQASERAVSIIKRYERGEGLFQLCPVHGFVDQSKSECNCPGKPKSNYKSGSECNVCLLPRT